MQCTFICNVSSCMFYALFVAPCSNTIFCDNSDEEQHLDIRPGDDGDDDAMSITSSAIYSVASDMPTEELEQFVTNMFETLMRRTTPAVAATPARRATRTDAGGTAETSPGKIDFDNLDTKVLSVTENISNAILALTIEELWCVQQHVDEAKIKYDMKKCNKLNRYKDNVWKYGNK